MQTALSTQATQAQRSARSFRVRRALTVLLFLSPAIVIYSLLVFAPLFQAVFYGLYDWNGLGPAEDYVGLGNFRKVLSDQSFQGALKHNVAILLMSLLIQLPLALALALLVGRKMRGRAIYRTIFFLPYVLSEVVTAVVWRFLYQPNSGINALLDDVSSWFDGRAWLGNPDTVLYSLFLVITWKYVGLYIILFMAGMQSIPNELEEAALVDGATPARATWNITIPLLGPTVRLCIFLSAVGSLQIFDLVWAMTTGGPVGASETMATYMYKFGMTRFQLGYGAAVSVVIFTICFIFALFYQQVVMRRDLEGAAT
jgi:raffinose/stachyose/melibiose transport system permease protein